MPTSTHTRRGRFRGTIMCLMAGALIASALTVAGAQTEPTPEPETTEVWSGEITWGSWSYTSRGRTVFSSGYRRGSFGALTPDTAFEVDGTSVTIDEIKVRKRHGTGENALYFGTDTADSYDALEGMFLSLSFPGEDEPRVAPIRRADWETTSTYNLFPDDWVHPADGTTVSVEIFRNDPPSEPPTPVPEREDRVWSAEITWGARWYGGFSRPLPPGMTVADVYVSGYRRGDGWLSEYGALTPDTAFNVDGTSVTINHIRVHNAIDGVGRGPNWLGFGVDTEEGYDALEGMFLWLSFPGEDEPRVTDFHSAAGNAAGFYDVFPTDWVHPAEGTKVSVAIFRTDPTSDQPPSTTQPPVTTQPPTTQSCEWLATELVRQTLKVARLQVEVARLEESLAAAEAKLAPVTNAPVTKPQGRPSGFTATPLTSTSTQINLAWDDPDPADKVTGWVVYGRPVARGFAPEVVERLGADARGTQVTASADHRRWAFWVAAENAAGEGRKSFGARIARNKRTGAWG